jgi:hypothetical protein
MASLFRYLGDAVASVFGRGPQASEDFVRKGGVQAFRLLQNPHVHAELGLDIERIGHILRLTREARQRRRKRFMEVQALGLDKGQQEAARLRREVAEEVMAGLDREAVLTAEQKERLRQITLQRLGAIAFVDPLLQETLGLTPGQKEVMLNMLKETGAKVRAAVQGADAEGKEAALALRKEQLDKVLALLNDEQKAQWEQLKGKPFEVDLEGAAPPGLDAG